MAEASSGPKERKDSESSVVFIFFLIILIMLRRKKNISTHIHSLAFLDCSNKMGTWCF